MQEPKDPGSFNQLPGTLDNLLLFYHCTGARPVRRWVGAASRCTMNVRLWPISELHYLLMIVGFQEADTQDLMINSH